MNNPFKHLISAFVTSASNIPGRSNWLEILQEASSEYEHEAHAEEKREKINAEQELADSLKQPKMYTIDQFKSFLGTLCEDMKIYQVYQYITPENINKANQSSTGGNIQSISRPKDVQCELAYIKYVENRNNTNLPADSYAEFYDEYHTTQNFSGLHH